MHGLDVLVWLAFLLGLSLDVLLQWVADKVRKPGWAPRRSSGCVHCDWRPNWLLCWPIVSSIWFRGQCPNCKNRLTFLNELLSLAMGAIFAASLQLANSLLQWVAWSLFWTLLLLIVRTDWLYMKVPNVLSIPGALVLYIVSVASGLQTWTSALLGLAVGGGVLFALHVVSGGRMGLGDAKLYLAIGAVLGAVGSVESLIFASCSGSVLGLTMRGLGLMKKRQYMPFVPHILIGVVLTAFVGPTLVGWYLHELLRM